MRPEKKVPLRRRKWFLFLISLISIAILCEAALLAAVVLQADRLNDPQPADVLIVLGARVDPDGSPSPALQRRLDLAYSLYSQGMAGYIITTGAQGGDEPLPEGDAMKAYLISQGADPQRVFSETTSYNTQENLSHAQLIMAENGLETSIVVTSDYHLWRALTICGDIGLSATGAGSQNALTFPVAAYNCFRETLSWVKYILTSLL